MMGGVGPRGHMMKVFFAIADTNGDGALSFEEVTAIHKRIFDKIDANKDGKVTIFVPPHKTDAPEGAMGEGIAIDAAGNLFTAEATVRGVFKYVK